MLNTYLPVLFQMYKEFYDSGVYNEDNLKYFVSIGTLSEEDYQKIVTKDNGENKEIVGDKDAESTKQNRWKFTIGLLVLAIGLCLLATPDYFFWPPQYKNLMNDDGIDVFIIISGLLLILYSLSNLHSNKIASVLLAISAAIVASITFIEIIHWYFAGMFRNNLTIVLAIFAVVVIFLVSYDRSIDS